MKDLEREGVAKLIIESRGVQDRDDRGTILDAQRAGLVSHDLRYDFAGKEEPLLWLADAVAGICRMLSLVETSPDWWHCNKP